MADLDAMAVRPAKARELIGVGKTKLYELLASGDLDSFLAGPQTRLIPIAAIERWINEHTPHAS